LHASLSTQHHVTSASRMSGQLPLSAKRMKGRVRRCEASLDQFAKVVRGVPRSEPFAAHSGAAPGNDSKSKLCSSLRMCHSSSCWSPTVAEGTAFVEENKLNSVLNRSLPCLGDDPTTLPLILL